MHETSVSISYAVTVFNVRLSFISDKSD